MAREQFGICAEPSLHGYYLLFNVLDDKNAHIRQALSRLPALFDKYADRFSEANLAGVVAIGANYWDELYPHARPTAIGERVRAPLPLPFTILYWGCRATVEPLRILTTEGRSLLHITQRGPPDSDS